MSRRLARGIPRRLLTWSRGLRARLTLWYLAIVLVVLGAFSVVVYVGLERTLRAELDHALELAAGQAAAASANAQRGLPAGAVPSGYAATLYDPAGRLLASDPRYLPLPLDPAVARRVAEGRAVRRSLEFDDDPWRVMAQPVVVDEQLAGIIQVARSEESIEEALEGLADLLSILLPVTLVLAGGGGLFLAGRALDPIDRITGTAATIDAEDLTRRLPASTAARPNEVGRLAATFNHMLDRLEGTFQRQRQFTADASHELRTPVTLLLSQIDVALDGPESTEAYRQVLTSLRADAIRLRRLLDALLTLARADARQNLLSRERLDLGGLARGAVEAFGPLATERGLDLRVAAEPDVLVEADEARLLQLLVNLLENALTHTPAGGEVAVTVAHAPNGQAILAVRDTGSGIPPEHQPHIFERFYRVDPARSAGGAGLGLAISRWIAEAHGGTLEVVSEPGAGSTFTVSLPRPAPDVVRRDAPPQP